MKLEPDLKHLTPDNLAECLSKIVPDHKNKKCRYATKHQIYKAVCTFYKFLIRKGLRTQADLDALKSKVPKRLYPARKTVLQEDTLAHLLEVNETKIQGRSFYDVAMTKMLILLFSMTGLRRSEVVNLEVSHIDLNNGILHVIDGKGHKNRMVGITPELEQQIRVWLEDLLNLNIHNSFFKCMMLQLPLRSSQPH